jgi:predicted nucleic acid-binding protein
MRVIIDTSIWSLVLRRHAKNLGTHERASVAECKQLVSEARAVLLGVVRQELLSGITKRAQFHALREKLRQFGDEPLSSEDHEHAAACFNRCRAKGVQGSVVDMLICAVAERRGMAVFTTDADFCHYAKHLPFRLHKPQR